MGELQERLLQAHRVLPGGSGLDLLGWSVGDQPPAGKDDHAAGGGMGLRAMRERVEQLGGSLVIDSAPGEGTTIAAELPSDTGGHQR